MDLKIASELQQLNFSHNEAKVYEALAKLGQTTAGEVIKNTRFHRSVTYDTLEKLIARKLIFKLIKKNVTYYQLTDPNKLLHAIHIQEEIAQDLIPKIKNLMNNKLPEITVYEGRESWRNYWLGTAIHMKEESTDYVAGSMGKKWQEIMGKESVEKFLRTHIKRRIKWKMIIFNKNSLEVELLKQYPELHEYRLVEASEQDLGNFNILEDKSVVLNSATEPMVIEIKNPTLVRTFRNLFDVMWKSGVEIK